MAHQSKLPLTLVDHIPSVSGNLLFTR